MGGSCSGSGGSWLIVIVDASDERDSWDPRRERKTGDRVRLVVVSINGNG